MARLDADGVRVPAFFYMLYGPDEDWPTHDWAVEAGRDSFYGINEPGAEYDLQPLPNGMADWTYVHTCIKDGQHHRFFCDVTLPDADLDALPDIKRVHMMCFVSARARAIIEAHDPAGATWIPATLRGRPSEVAAPQGYSVMLPRRMFHSNNENAEQKPNIDFTPVFPGFYAEMQYNPVTRAFFEDIPLWCAHGRYDHPVFSELLFRTLKRAGVTGIEERTGPCLVDWEGGTIGHILHEPPRAKLECRW